MCELNTAIFAVITRLLFVQEVQRLIKSLRGHSIEHQMSGRIGDYSGWVHTTQSTVNQQSHKVRGKIVFKYHLANCYAVSVDVYVIIKLYF